MSKMGASNEVALKDKRSGHDSTDQDRNEKELLKLKKLAQFLDETFQVPGTNYKIGIDGFVGLLPVAGDFIPLLFSLYFVWSGFKLGIKRRKIFKMLLNIGIDFFGGCIPIVGDFFDFAWKCNLRNYKIIEAALKDDNRS